MGMFTWPNRRWGLVFFPSTGYDGVVVWVCARYEEQHGAKGLVRGVHGGVVAILTVFERLHGKSTCTATYELSLDKAQALAGATIYPVRPHSTNSTGK